MEIRMKKVFFALFIALGATLLLFNSKQSQENGFVDAVSLEKKESHESGLNSLERTRQPASSTKNSEAPSARSTPAALMVAGFPSSGSDPISAYINNESLATVNRDSALDAFRMLNSCSSLPSPDEIPSEMNAQLGLASARDICSEIQERRVFRRDELITFAADLGSVEATLLLPSFPPPFSQAPPDSQEVSENVLDWQQRIIGKLQDIADSGNSEAQLRLARLFSGEFPAYEDRELAKSYVELALATGHLTPYQVSLAQNLLRKLPE